MMVCHELAVSEAQGGQAWQKRIKLGRSRTSRIGTDRTDEAVPTVQGRTDEEGRTVLGRTDARRTSVPGRAWKGNVYINYEFYHVSSLSFKTLQ